MDLASVVGLLLGLLAIVGGHILEGGQLGSILQPTAAVIVFGGTLGATLLSYPLRDALQAVRMTRAAFRDHKVDLQGTAEEIGALAEKARRDGIVALEGDLGTTRDPFLGRALGHLVDGMAAPALRETLENAQMLEEEREMSGSKVYEAAGGYAPTIGILGAVLGLIHVMERLTDPSRLGEGIAVAFVATVYGVGSANLVFLPLATKLKRRIQIEGTRRMMIIDGVADIAAGVSPRAIREKLAMYVTGPRQKAA